MAGRQSIDNFFLGPSMWFFSQKTWISRCTWWAPPEIHDFSPWAAEIQLFVARNPVFGSNHKERPPESSLENGDSEKLSYESLERNAHRNSKPEEYIPVNTKKCFNFSCQSDAYGVRQSATHAQKYLWPILLLGNWNLPATAAVTSQQNAGTNELRCGVGNKITLCVTPVVL